MPRYNVQVLSGEGEVVAVKGFHAYNDEEAAIKARKLVMGKPFRLLEGVRQVPIYSPSTKSS
jgi:hypothetical protein